MDKDRIQGKAEDIAGRAKRQVGEWTGDSSTQAEGAMDQAKGKARNALGKVKDAVRDAADEVKGEKRDVETDQERTDRKDEDAA
ncbi:MAG TPA: CsbD family protein [Candidatus Angelobacter sp.]|nr:CsbD family protein [Candidatus Angelobacter sp.]